MSNFETRKGKTRRVIILEEIVIKEPIRSCNIRNNLIEWIIWNNLHDKTYKRLLVPCLALSLDAKKLSMPRGEKASKKVKGWQDYKDIKSFFVNDVKLLNCVLIEKRVLLCDYGSVCNLKALKEKLFYPFQKLDFLEKDNKNIKRALREIEEYCCQEGFKKRKS